MERIKNFLKEEEGVTMIEYGLLAALIAVVLIGTIQALTGSLTTMFGKVETAVAGS